MRNKKIQRKKPSTGWLFQGGRKTVCYMEPDDNPPIGLLLCTAYGKEMAEYLKPFTDPQLFIAKYELQLPAKEKIQQFLMRENTVKR